MTGRHPVSVPRAAAAEDGRRDPRPDEGEDGRPDERQNIRQDGRQDAHQDARRDARQDARQDAQWREAIGLTVALWLFVLLLYLPIIAQRHAGEGAVSVALDGMTVFVSMAFALPIFALFRATLTRPLPLRVALLVLAVLVVSIVQAAFDLLFTAWVAHTLERSWEALPRDMARGYGAMINYISVFGVNLALFQFAFARRRSRRGERRLADLVAADQKAEIAALRFKLNPHFLFNTLNAVSSMIVTRRNDEADLLVERLSAFLRASFSYDAASPIAVEEEFATVDHYAAIEQLRFGDRLAVAIHCEPAAAGLMMPPLLVQPVIERLVDEAAAIAGVEGRSMHVRVVARAEPDALVIAIAHDTSGLPPLVGLVHACLGARLAALYGDRPVIVARDCRGATAVELRLPRHVVPPIAGGAG